MSLIQVVTEEGVPTVEDCASPAGPRLKPAEVSFGPIVTEEGVPARMGTPKGQVSDSEGHSPSGSASGDGSSARKGKHPVESVSLVGATVWKRVNVRARVAIHDGHEADIHMDIHMDCGQQPGMCECAACIAACPICSPQGKAAEQGEGKVPADESLLQQADETEEAIKAVEIEEVAEKSVAVCLSRRMWPRSIPLCATRKV